MAKGNFGQSCIVMEFDRGIEEGWYRSIENCCQGHGQHSNHNENIWSHGQVRSSGPPPAFVFYRWAEDRTPKDIHLLTK